LQPVKIFNIKLNKILYILLLNIITINGAAYAEELVKPIDVKNTYVLYISHIFMPVESSSTLNNGTNDFSVTVMESNTNYAYFDDYKKLRFDLETTSVMINYIKKIGESWEIKAVLPYYYHSGGFMDHSIESFHKSFPAGGLTNGGREYFRDNDMCIRYQTNHSTIYITDPVQGFGDPSLFVKKIFRYENPGITVSAGLKPQCGDKNFINSGTTDLAAAVNCDYRTGMFYVYGMTGYSRFFGDGIYREELDQNRDFMIIFAAGAGVQISGSLYLSIQFYCHTSIYDTGIDRVDDMTVYNSYALRWSMADSTVIQFSIDEDPFTYASTDIAFSLRCEYTF
jgi:hypothetical protein